MEFSTVKSIILDIEGTTTSISFVQETLFPYVRKNLTSYLEQNWDKDELKDDIQELKKQAEKDKADNVEGAISIEDGEKAKDSAEKNILWNMDLDRKTTALKQFQGHLWRDGYSKGEIKGHIYPEVAETLKSWKEGGRRLYVYSSGSVEAQKLLFGHSEAGDLLDLLEGHFDTKTGPKTEVDSYKTIAKEIGYAPEELLFLTDVVKEAEAAEEAGMKVAIVIREGNAPLTEEMCQKYHTIHALSDLSMDKCAKRAKIANDDGAVVNGKIPDSKEETKMETSVAEVEKPEVTSEATVVDEPMETTEDTVKEAEVVSSSDETKEAASESSPSTESKPTDEKKTESETTVPDENVTSTVAEKAEDVSIEKCDKVTEPVEEIKTDKADENKDGTVEKEEVSASETEAKTETVDKPEEKICPDEKVSNEEKKEKPVEKVATDVAVKVTNEGSCDGPKENGSAEKTDLSVEHKEETKEVVENKENGVANGENGKMDDKEDIIAPVNGKGDEVTTNGTEDKVNAEKIETVVAKVIEDGKEAPPPIEVAAE